MPTKPTSNKKSATARANGAKSHGPATRTGRARSSQNALRHGLAVRDAALPTVSVVLDDESPDDFQRLLDSYLDEFAPTSPIEVELVETMVSARWRLRRLANIETNLLGNEIESSLDDVDRQFAGVGREADADDRLAYVFKRLSYGASLHLLLRYEGTLSRSYARAFKQLEQLQARRNRPQPNEPKPAAPSIGAAPTLRPIPSNKGDDPASPAPPPVLQIPPQPPKIRLDPQPNPVPARQIPAPPPQAGSTQAPTYK